MDCLQCGKPALPRKALCAECYAGDTKAAGQASSSRIQAPREAGFGRLSREPEELIPAGFWLRLLAYIIDHYLIAIVQLAILAPLWSSGALTALIVTFNAPLPVNPNWIFYSKTGTLVMLYFKSLAIAFALDILYYSLFECSPLRATPGKLFFRMAVTDALGGRAGFFHSLIRQIAKLSWLIFYFAALVIALVVGGHEAKRILLGGICGSGLIAVIGYLMAGIGSEKQALHDLLTCSYVVRSSHLSPVRVLVGIGLVLAPIILAVALNGAFLPFSLNPSISYHPIR